MNKVVLVGIGGYGENYLGQMLKHGMARNARLVGCVDPFASSCRKIEELRQMNVPIYGDLAEFYKNHSADLTVISSPIHYHKSQTLQALATGSNVLCEKPIAVLTENAEAMSAAAEKARRFVAIGYQLSFSSANLALKKDILAGLYGKPLRFKTITCWPRWESYYKRNNWAGRIKTDDGQRVLDSPVNNATSHYLHNMLFIAGPAINKSASPVNIHAELYRAKPCENYDTAAMHIITDNDVEILFFTTHSCKIQIGPTFEFEFENGKVTFANTHGILIGHLNDGQIIQYGNPLEDDMLKLWICIDAVRTGHTITCDVQTALPHIICVNKVQEFPIHNVSQQNISVEENNGDRLIYINNIEKIFTQCFETGVLPLTQLHSKTSTLCHRF